MASKKSELFEWIQAIVIAVVLALLIRTFVFEIIQVQGASMFSTLREADRILVYKTAYRISTPEPGDIVVFQNPEDPSINYIKRVIAVEGDIIEIRDGQLYINEQAVEENYLREPMVGEYPKSQVPPDTIFVLGDNRNYSKDSRHPKVGFIPLENLVGKAKLRIWPLVDVVWFS
jgi:signal peptidase I